MGFNGLARSVAVEIVVNGVLRTLSVGVGAAKPIARSARQRAQARKRRKGGGK